MNKPQQQEQKRTGPQGTTLFQADQMPEVRPVHDQNAAASSEKPILVGVSDPFEGQRFVLDRGRLSVGRREDNDIVLAEPSVSSMHAWLIGENGHWRVMNMLSTNGTYVNDVKVHEQPIEDGDRIRFGSVAFVFRTQEEQASANKRLPMDLGLPLRVWAIIGIALVLLLLWMWW